MAKRGSIFLNLLDLDAKDIKNILESVEDIDEVLENKDFTAKKAGHIDKELELIEKEGITCLDIFDPDYPYLLRQIANPPLVLYIKGDKSVLSKASIAIVGSRRSTAYGNNMAADFSYQLSCRGLVIVSGLAKGIDTAAHKAAIKKGKSIAVLGSGLLDIYPRENIKLAQAISEQGAIVSEFPLSKKPLSENFPRRNRIVSGISLGVLIVEAALRSGALITARLACEQNREVFAMPGNVDSDSSGGTNKLIQEGAKLVCKLEDILEELNYGQVFSNC